MMISPKDSSPSSIAIVKKELVVTFTSFVLKPIEDTTIVTGKLFTVKLNSPASLVVVPVVVPFTRTFM